jgi:PAS domain S-box-containing protein
VTLQDSPIRRKLMSIMLLTSGLVLLVTCTAFMVSEVLTFRRNAVRELSTVGRIIAANSTAALAFQNQEDAREVLAALRAESHIIAATLYDSQGRRFAIYPDHGSADSFPSAPQTDGFRFEHSSLVGFEPVVQGDKRLGTLYLQADLGALYERLRLYAAIALLVIAVSLLAAYLVARKLQEQISRPILALAETAKAVSERRDYSVRAPTLGQDELGLLTDAFNQMLTRIEQQNQALRDSEEQVRAVVDSAQSAVVVSDGEGTIVDWNSRAESMFGLTRGEALGRRFEETILPEGERVAYQRAREDSIGTGDGDGGNTPVGMTALRRDRSAFPVELAVSRLETADAVRFCSFITDITDRKVAEEKLHAQLARHTLLNRITRAIGERQDLPSIFQVLISTLEDNLPLDVGCVCLYDAASESLTVTGVGTKGRELAKALGLADQTRLPVDTSGLSRCVRGELVYEPDVSGSTFGLPQRLAQQGLGSLIVAPLLLESQVFGILVAARRETHGFSSPDCEFLRQLGEHIALATHQAQIYGALQRAYDDLRQSQQTVLQHERLRALGEMASGIAHDINNAISPVALYTEILLESEPNLSPVARDYLETIERAIGDVAATIARMGEFYRKREPQVALGPTDLNRLVQQVLRLTSARWSDMPQQRGMVIETVTDLAPELPPVLAAENEIREALTNLIFNAVDAMPEGGTLTLRTKVTGSIRSTNGGPVLQHAHVEVSDSGLGMEEETRQRCLEPFFTTKGERGTGLGLAMVYGMVQRHSADIEIESARGKGTTVRLSFAVPTVMAEARQAGTPRIAPAPLRILIVDDDPLLLKALRDTLETCGHRIVAAAGGQAGIDTFHAALNEAEPFAVVITDLGMPYVDGRHVASAVKQASPSTPVIMLTGWGQRMTEEAEIPPHVDRVLSKPPKLRELNAALIQCGPVVPS